MNLKDKSENDAHRSQLKLILKKEQTRWPLFFGAALVALIICAAIMIFLPQSAEKSANYSRRKFDEMKGKAQQLINDEQWVEARQFIDSYVTFDSKIRQEKNDFFDQKFQKPFEFRLLQAITRFATAYPNGQPDEINAAANNLEKLLAIPVTAMDIKEAMDATVLNLNRYRYDQKATIFKTKLANIKATIKDRLALEDAYNALLKEDLPESIANKAREEVSQLSKNRIESARILKQCRRLQEKGDLETARLELERLKTLYISAPWAEAMETSLKQIAADKNKAQIELERIEGLRKNAQPNALIKFLDSKPPQFYASRALDILHALHADDPETKLTTALREAERLPATESRLKILELVKQYPYAKASWKASIKVNVVSEPSGAEITLVGFKDEIKGKTPLTLSLPVLARFSLTFKMPSFHDYEFSNFGFCDDKLSVTLNRQEALARRLPVTARNGIGLMSNGVIIVGESELTLCSRPEMSVIKRIKLSAPNPSDELKMPVTIIESQALISSAKSLLRVRFPDGNLETANLSDIATSAALPTQNKKSLIVATKAGWELFHFENMKLVKKIAFDDILGNPPLRLLSSDSDLFFAHREDGMVMAIDSSSNKRWSENIGAKLIGAPAWNRSASAIAVMDVLERITVCDANSGAKRFQRKLNAPSAFACISLEQGFLALLKGGKAALYSTKEDKLIWSTTFAGEAVLPALAVMDKAVAIGVSQGDEHYLFLLAANSGDLLWRAHLYAKPVSLAADDKHILVSTEDGEISIFELQ